MRKFDYYLLNGSPLEALQCGRIYKDAEIGVYDYAGDRCVLRRFNVAASIKMRKFCFRDDDNLIMHVASMWPHL